MPDVRPSDARPSDSRMPDVRPSDARPSDARPSDSRPSFRSTAFVVLAYAVAMAYLESAIVVYLNGALDTVTGDIFPLRSPDSVGPYAAIEVGREAATLVMLATIGWLAGRGALERLAWTAVAFGAWDIAYYGWLWVFAGWPTSPGTFDLLFLIPVPWAGPIWAPVAVSLALTGFGLAAARGSRLGWPLRVSRVEGLAALAGGVIVVVSFTLQARSLMAGEMPGDFAWPVFVAGMLLAMGAATTVLSRAASAAGRAGPPSDSSVGSPASR